ATNATAPPPIANSRTTNNHSMLGWGAGFRAGTGFASCDDLVRLTWISADGGFARGGCDTGFRRSAFAPTGSVVPIGSTFSGSARGAIDTDASVLSRPVGVTRSEGVGVLVTDDIGSCWLCVAPEPIATLTVV